MFNFGSNWEKYSENKVTEETIKQASESIHRLCGDIAGKTFLDIGCGSGVFSIAASDMGATKVIGFDISKECIDVSNKNLKRLSPNSLLPEHCWGISQISKPRGSVEFMIGDVLEMPFLARIGKFDIVYAWGSLHHTGNMMLAAACANNLVNRGGLLAMSIYNKHWTSPIWKMVKLAYNSSHRYLQKLIALSLGVVIYLAKFITTGKDPLKKERGMDFWYDVVDWVGGYPYEYATPTVIINEMRHRRNHLVKTNKPAVPTGCNEFVFRKII